MIGNPRPRAAVATDSKQRGVALLASLILMLAVVMALANIFYRHQIDVAQATSSVHGDQALLLAISGENWARDLLSEELDDPDVDSFDEDWAQAMPLMPVDGGQLSGCISDLQANINLNNFAAYGVQTLKSEMDSDVVGHAKLWINLLQLLELSADPSRIATIIDWVDEDSTPINSWGAEQAEYDSMQPPRVPANSRIADVSELAAISGYEVFEVQRLAPWLAALPVTTKININTAADEVLTAMGGDFAEQFMEAVIEDRPFSAVADFHQAISRAFQLSLPDTSMRWPASLVDVKSDYFQLYMEVSLGEARIEVKSIMDRRDRGAPVIISREVVVVPASLPEQNPEKLSAAEALFADEGRNINQSMETNRVQPACLMMGEFTQ
ncbi:type II secretion system minor pseudopilin GspK [Porticoccaceae bacterium]|jgi:general secretion pathway protein K|nr:type II secretion system minor pseudopilin GspK [Porticoccaceae bacterium]